VVLSLQYLRALAAFMVLMEHVGMKSAQHSENVLSGWHVGGAGVDLFFLISGFIMCYTTANKHQTVGASRQFLWRRVTRIIPLYWIVTCLGLLVYLVMPAQVNGGAGADIIQSYLLLPSEKPYLVANGWTLRFEFLFYGVFMLGLLLNRRLGNLSVIATLIVMVGFGLWHVQQSIWGIFLTSELLLEFAFGMLLYHNFERLKQLSMVTLIVILGVGIGALLAVNQGPQVGSRVIDFGLPMVFIMAGVLGLEKLLQERPINFLKMMGDTSYAMYLIHPFALAGGAMVLSKLGLSGLLGGWFLVAVLLIASLVAGYLLYEWVEKPIAKFINKRPAVKDDLEREDRKQPLRRSI